jgi:hypothetical protein
MRCSVTRTKNGQVVHWHITPGPRVVGTLLQVTRPHQPGVALLYNLAGTVPLSDQESQLDNPVIAPMTIAQCGGNS